MTRASATLLVIATALIVAGVALWTVPGALVVGGLLAGAAGVLMLERPDPADRTNRKAPNL